MNTKKLICTILLVSLIPFYVVLALLTSSNRVGENVATHKQQLNIIVEDGVIADAVDYVPFLIPQDGKYKMTLDFTTVDPGFYTGIVLKDAKGNAVLYNGFDTVVGYTEDLTLPEGRTTLELHYFSNEQALRDFCADYPIYSKSQLDSIESKLHFNDRIKSGNWYTSLNLSIDEYARTPIALKIGVIAFSFVLFVMLMVLLFKDHSSEEDDRKTRLSSLGIRYAIFMFLIFLLEIVVSVVLSFFLTPEAIEENNGMLTMLLTIFVIDICGFSTLYLITRKVPAQKLEKRPFGVGKFLQFLMITLGLTIVGALIGIPVENLFPNNQSVDIAEILLGSSMPLRILAVGILAPIIEELIFRKLLIDRLIKHGEFAAIFLSGLTFGLFHGNFQQFFFATLNGWLWAFIYIRTGNIRNTISLHMTINLGTSVVTMFLFGRMAETGILDDGDPAAIAQALMSNPTALTYAALFSLWVILIFLLALIGVILFFVKVAKKDFALNRLEDEPTKVKVLAQIFTNPYMWIFFLVLLGQFIMSYLPSMMK